MCVSWTCRCEEGGKALVTPDEWPENVSFMWNSKSGEEEASSTVSKRAGLSD